MSISMRGSGAGSVAAHGAAGARGTAGRAGALRADCITALVAAFAAALGAALGTAPWAVLSFVRAPVRQAGAPAGLQLLFAKTLAKLSSSRSKREPTPPDATDTS